MKKAQIQFMETIFVLLILVVTIFIGVIFTFLFLNRSVSEKFETITLTDAITLTDSVISMPEFTCGKTENCLDAQKIIAFQELTLDPTEKTYYETLFKSKRITLKIIYPKVDPDKIDMRCITPLTGPGYPASTCGWFLLYGEDIGPEFSQRLESPAQIYFPLIDKKAIGILTIEVYEE